MKTPLLSKEFQNGNVKIGDYIVLTCRNGTESYSGTLISVSDSGFDVALLTQSGIQKITILGWFVRNVSSACPEDI